jgi:hypothetical protein
MYSGLEKAHLESMFLNSINFVGQALKNKYTLYVVHASIASPSTVITRISVQFLEVNPESHIAVYLR